MKTRKIKGWVPVHETESKTLQQGLKGAGGWVYKTRHACMDDWETAKKCTVTVTVDSLERTGKD